MLGMWSGVFTLCFLLVVAAPPAQLPIKSEDGNAKHVEVFEHTDKKRPLHGRFLHLTDFHPDRYYQLYSSTAQEAACHRGQGPAGIYGAETSECDSPIELINKTLEWVGSELKDQIDFVVWTGDSARHDNDEEIPRNADQVISLNKLMVNKMFEVFGKHNGDEDDEDPTNDFVVPIIPNIGNNDILPHNVMVKGPNTWTRTYAKVWRQFIPEVQKHQFEQGGWFYVEVIPNKLAVFSLNTLYFFKNNAAVDGCAAPSEPGYQQMDWLRIQLQFMRERGVKAILTGHVPPIRQEAKTAWDETCWQKYTLWLRQYRDVVVSSLWGHFNYDHFMLQDFKDLDKDTKHGRMENYHTDEVGHEESDNDFNAAVSNDYFLQLREAWSKIPEPPHSLKQDRQQAPPPSKDKKKEQKEREEKFLKAIGGPYAERFAASFVSASVVPNLFPTLRVYEYNISGLEAHNTRNNEEVEDVALPAYVHTPTAEEEEAEMILLKKKKKEKKYKFAVPHPPSKSAPPGPAYSPQTFSFLKYTTYFANITHINNDFPSTSHADDDKLEDHDDEEEEEVGEKKWKEGKHKGKKPHDKDHRPQPRAFKFHVQYETQEDDVYQLADLTMPNLVDLARRIGGFVPEKEDVTISGGVDGDGDDEGVVEEDLDVSEEKDGKDGKKKKKKKKKHGKGKKGRKHSKQNEAWFTFMRRAFVETMDAEELEERFGH